MYVAAGATIVSLLLAIHLLSLELLRVWFPFGKLMHAFPFLCCPTACSWPASWSTHMIDMAVLKQFQEAICHLGEMAQPKALGDAERLARAKAVMHDKTDRALALDLESCVNCGHRPEACHF